MEDEKQVVEQPRIEEGQLESQKKSVFLAAVFYILGLVLIVIAIHYLSKDLKTDFSVYDFDEYRYVGGDAYNYIISAARSTAIMVKSLIYAVLGCTSLILGRLSH